MGQNALSGPLKWSVNIHGELYEVLHTDSGRTVEQFNYGTVHAEADVESNTQGGLSRQKTNCGISKSITQNYEQTVIN